MKKIIFQGIFILLLFSFHSDSQTPSFIPGEHWDADENTDLKFAGYNDNVFYIVKTEKEKKDQIGLICMYSRETLKQIYFSPIVIPPIDAKKFRLEEIAFDGSSLKIFYSYYSKKNDLNHLMVTEYNDKGPTEKATELMSFPGEDEMEAGRFKVYYDKDSRRITLMHYLIALRGSFSLKPTIQLKIMDGGLNVLYNKEVILGESKLGYTCYSMSSDKNGNICFLIKNISTFAKNNYQAVTVDIQSDKIENVFLTTERPTKKTLVDFMGSILSYDGDKTFYAIAHYANYSDQWERNGLYIAQINSQTGKLEKEKYTPFLNPEPGKKADAKGVIELGFYQFSYSNFNADRSAKILEECSSYGISSGNMMDVALDKELNITSNSFVSKSQQYTPENVPLEGCAAITIDNKSFFFYNQNFEDLKKRGYDLKMTKDLRKNTAACYGEMGNDGQQKHNPVKIDNYNTILFHVNEYLVMDKKEIIMLAEFDNDTRLMKIHFD